MNNSNKQTIPSLELEQYRSQIQLDKVFKHKVLSRSIQEEKSSIINDLLYELVNIEEMANKEDVPIYYQEQRIFLRALLNIRKPKPLSIEFIKKNNYLLQTELFESNTVTSKALPSVLEENPNSYVENGEKLALWQGDITKLEVDAIVNAANSEMLGCFQPLHACIDNAIHSAAGPQLREDCKIIVSIQEASEKTGDAKVTRAYNLPSKYVLHTVGPIVPKGTSLTDKQRRQLISCYISCLELASQVENIKSLAFCAISTGVFGFPKNEAAKIAVRTVDDWLSKNPDRFNKVIFNVFGKEDYDEYISVIRKYQIST
ncbi:protein-ADP-ribose hydrolase [Priestia megaterium]|uniref:protein-ADP-ribose hydrolase n=1 Tax=Priestia megaterium TaxID=1404 RepID=UPI00203D12DB|nr:protein-ADP-ribose hydrolase [Priestia megaterium]MCM3186856.1 protein-ADP-ribose hydrolase [Priestia megaterium]